MVKGPPVKWNDSKHSIRWHDKTRNHQKCCCRSRTQGCSYKHSQPQIESNRQTYYDHLWYRFWFWCFRSMSFWLIHEWEISPKGGERWNKVRHPKIYICMRRHLYLFISIFTYHSLFSSIYLSYLFIFYPKSTQDVFFYKFCMYMMYLYSVYVNRYMVSSLISFWGTV